MNQVIEVEKLNMFDSIDKAEAKIIADNLGWYLKSDYKFKDVNDDGESALLDSMYSGHQTFGCTDYIDHRKDTLKQLKELIYKRVAILDGHGYQRIHYYINRKTPYTKIVVYGYLGGFSGYFVE